MNPEDFWEHSEKGTTVMKSRLLIPDIIQSGWTDSAGILGEFRKNSYCQKTLDLYGKIRIGELYQSEIHGKGHIERVILLGAVLAWKEALPNLETSMLLAACAYHDIGRINDGLDREHGLRSARKMESVGLLEDFPEIPNKVHPVVYAAVASHCICAEDQPKMIELFGVKDHQMPRFPVVSHLLNSADRLDRVRLGDLDPVHLECDSARELVDFAEELYQKYSG